MRTTLTLDEDVAAKLRERCHRRRESFKATVNRTLRAGLNAEQTLMPREPFRVEARDLGMRPGVGLDNIAELLEQIDGPLNK